ncbi:MAG: ferrous iron transport protein A [Flammeovirgaceae bacterium]|nr:ferrous iron transport protein A [Flammeovirgaceae bacterium]
MQIGEKAIITGFLDEQLSTKLLEMGFIPGTTIQFNFSAPLGDPICVTVSGYDLSIRMDEASMILIGNG